MVFIHNAWQPGTLKAYDAVWRRWSTFTMANNSSPTDISTKMVNAFIADLGHKDYSTSYIYTHRSALSSLRKLARMDALDDESTKRLLQGLAKKKPSKPKYSEVWDPTIVINFIRDNYSKRARSDIDLLKRTLVLVRLALCARSSDLARWAFSSLVVSNTSIKGPIVNAKEQRASASQSTLVLKPVSGAAASRPPHQCLSADWITKLSLEVMEEAGIDTSIYGAHSTRAAVITKALASGASFQDVKALSRHKSATTMEKYYALKLEGSAQCSQVNSLFE
ncbi:hypothetical protein SAMD00019534_018230 [Acytostelium subglobosum LB1]|uniref:hypothetical protein n=1 Tax=Acytostelium subglobosum LB1 TaxID=1410327 RepID=UPI000644A6AC|nr:hypothetical protein SAMD00019534_018230 [Acytostelium subglobosum LB1]GAM18648.1 hypothetical protein SAMD00019534_018230 [Acytostelium subglobosum LB1]|eukprot:XP_012757868.1 hypothetical protein SAMD00019534_018230 [Acytostelium subglobosum LB1]